MDLWTSSNRKKSEEYFVYKWFHLLSNSRKHFEDNLGAGISMPEIIVMYIYCSLIVKQTEIYCYRILDTVRDILD